MTDKDDENPIGWPDDRYLTREEAARYARALGFRLQPSTLAKFAWRGDGPVMTFFGAKPYYRLGDFREWLLERTRRSRSTTRHPKPELAPPRKTNEDDAENGAADDGEPSPQK